METDDLEPKILAFPCEFPIKVMGAATRDFDLTVIGILLKHVADLKDSAIERRTSRTGKYLSVTVTIEAHSQDQLDDIYRELSGHERVLMVL